MDLLEYIISNKFYFTYLLELGAAICGSYYLKKNPFATKELRWFVYYLWLVFVVDFSGTYAIWAYLDNYETFPALRNSVFARNTWMYNILKIISFLAYCQLFILQLQNQKTKKILKACLGLYLIFAVYQCLTSENFFIDYIVINSFVGTFLLLICIGAYFYEMLISDKILYFSKNVVFYISLGAMIWHLTYMPLNIYNAYFNANNVFFMKIYSFVLTYSNVFMYSVFSFGFIFCSRKKKEKL
ncbi:hypothetical protein RM553_15935 [Zunongwangia sp. F363]|uniref:Uncharacterized protein n=1 Tax=Autumnicola tepida TaxID=3075595 RepID=A0ABU3CDB2_9FLAO|nr:hypothetical protein [Zunongwangia sp. F363]MDT0644329.1 hypothetical protein [Zunongwangia sp. F363]